MKKEITPITLKKKYTTKEKLEMIATTMTILVSASILFGFFYAHRQGFFSMVHRITEHHHTNVLEAQANAAQK